MSSAGNQARTALVCWCHEVLDLSTLGALVKINFNSMLHNHSLLIALACCPSDIKYVAKRLPAFQSEEGLCAGHHNGQALIAFENTVRPRQAMTTTGTGFLHRWKK